MAKKGTITSKAQLSASSIPLTDFRPYLSAVMLTGTLSNRKLVEALIKEADSRVVSTSSTKRTKLSAPSVDKQGDCFIGSIFYKETGSPAWDPGLMFEDVTHQFVWIVVRDKRAALIASDSLMRNSIQTALTSAAVIPRDETFNAFVGSSARAVWLNGTHAQTNAKPEAKVLIGTALEEALDPLGDHSFHMSALRSQPAISALRSKTLGVALSSGRVWSVRARSLADLSFAAPQIPVINNIDVTVQMDADAIRDALYRQAFGPVRWVECVQAIKARGVSHLVECGPGKVLMGLTKRIDADLTGAALYDPATLADVKELLA